MGGQKKRRVEERGEESAGRGKRRERKEKGIRRRVVERGKAKDSAIETYETAQTNYVEINILMAAKKKYEVLEITTTVVHMYTQTSAGGRTNDSCKQWKRLWKNNQTESRKQRARQCPFMVIRHKNWPHIITENTK